ncbi:hypothetical protein [Novosphingobium decolorationis]|uniref:hypothetical protein n=1 Tax=Novosphingobium decolorationis TaxID=2698673 RepID=UPI001BCCAA55|nr:hypothetical protein [Novosphingobium decolorationis]
MQREARYHPNDQNKILFLMDYFLTYIFALRQKCHEASSLIRALEKAGIVNDMLQQQLNRPGVA